MDFKVLYNIALDIIHKQEAIITSPDKNVCIIESENTIFTSISSYKTINNVLYNQCAEKKAIESMTQANIMIINQMLIVNCSTLKLMLPCQDCVNILIDRATKYNPKAVLYIDNNVSVYIKDLKSTDFKAILKGGTEDVPLGATHTSTSFEDLDPLQPQKQSVNIQEDVANIENTQSTQNISSLNIHEKALGFKKIFNKFKTSNPQKPKTENTPDNTQPRSKKELIMMAKERKKQVKKDAKLRDYFEKQEKRHQGKVLKK